MSLNGLAAELSTRTGLKITKNTVHGYETGHSPITDVVRRAYGELVANVLTAQVGREIGITLTINSPWAIRPFARCAVCDCWFPMVTQMSKRCPVCARR